MLAFICCDMRDSRKDVGRMSGCSLDTISVVDAAFPSFGVNVEVLEVIVKVNRPST